jgi:hypothetical protein
MTEIFVALQTTVMSELTSDRTYSIFHFHFSFFHSFIIYLLASEAARMLVLKSCAIFLQVSGYLSCLTPRVNRPGRQVDDLLSSNVLLMLRLRTDVAVSILPHTSCHGVHWDFAFTFIVSSAILFKIVV